MVQIDESAYADIRRYFRKTYTHAALIDDNGDEVVRIDIANDLRGRWITNDAERIQVATLTISPDDADIPTPSEIIRIEYYDTASGGDRKFADSTDVITLESGGDSVTFSVYVKVPR